MKESVKLALANNHQMKVADAVHRKARLEANLQERVGSRADLESLPGAQQRYLLTKQTQAQAIIADKNREVARQQLTYQVEKAYYQLLQARQMVDLEQQALEQSEREVAKVQAQVEVGSSSKGELLAMKAHRAEAKSRADSAGIRVELAQAALNQLAGLPLDTRLALTDIFTLKPEFAVSLEKSIETGLKDRLEIHQAREELSVAEVGLDLAKEYLQPNMYQYQIYAAEVERTKENLALQKEKVELEVRQAYWNVVDALQRLEVYNEQKAFLEENQRLAQLREEVGLSSALETYDAKLQVHGNQLQYLQALLDFNLAKAELDIATGQGQLPNS